MPLATLAMPLATLAMPLATLAMPPSAFAERRTGPAPALDRRFGWSAVPTAVVVAGQVLLTACYVLVFFVFRANTFASSVIEVDARQTVVATGPYRFVVRLLAEERFLRERLGGYVEYTGKTRYRLVPGAW
jgi:protein-S-isoprenylcysteine O-methyltransferase Ste14